AVYAYSPGRCRGGTRASAPGSGTPATRPRSSAPPPHAPRHQSKAAGSADSRPANAPSPEMKKPPAPTDTGGLRAEWGGAAITWRVGCQPGGRPLPEVGHEPVLHEVLAVSQRVGVVPGASPATWS